MAEKYSKNEPFCRSLRIQKLTFGRAGFSLPSFPIVALPIVFTTMMCVHAKVPTPQAESGSQINVKQRKQSGPTVNLAHLYAYFAIYAA